LLLVVFHVSIFAECYFLIFREVIMDRKRFLTDPKGAMLALFGASEQELVSAVHEALSGADDGELFVECAFTRALSFEGGKVETLSYTESGGIGLRRVVGEAQFYASGNEFSLNAVRDFATRLSAASGDGEFFRNTPSVQTLQHYDVVDVFDHSVEAIIERLRALDAKVRAFTFEERPAVIVEDVELSISSQMKCVLIVRMDGFVACDIRPMLFFSAAVRCAEGKETEWGTVRLSGRRSFDDLLSAAAMERTAREASLLACDLLFAKPCPSGNMPVVLGNGWGGVLVHEAIGHALEGDAIREKDSVFVGKLGTMVASPIVTIVDDGTLHGLRGSLNFDDEGTPTERTVLIENGVLKAFMNDRLSARVLGLPQTGSARRESFRSPPIVRMRNTFVDAGTDDPKDIIADTAYGLYVKDFSGGQVDPRTGKFTFTADMGYVIKDGVIAHAVRGVTLMGDCREALLHIDRVGNDLDHGGGYCGKSGQTVPVCVGQPTMRLCGGVTVGGTV
jgi:TldD protein